MSEPLRSSLLARLGQGPASAAELSQATGYSQPTISRALQSLRQSSRVVRLGATKGARYGLTRAVGSAGREWPLYRIDEAGTPGQIATVHAIAPDSYLVQGGPARIQGISPGLPYYLQDARPAGFLGRAIPAMHPELSLPPRVVDWNDTHVITYLTQRGSEGVGNLVLGAEALNRYLRAEHGATVVSHGNRAIRYPELAARAMAGTAPGSSAHGEHPKFAARVGKDDSLTHVLVKFSPPLDTPAGVRWSDLLVAEHLAAITLDESGIPAAPTEVLQSQGRTFLQSQRFDRVGDDGRRGVASLLAVSVQFHGEIDRWSAAAGRLHRDGLIAAEDAERLVLIDTFGALIANSDRHFGNVTLFDDYAGRFRLAPVYDMLPMLFAPQDGQITEREFEPPPPTAENLRVWQRALDLAENYWARVAADARVSDEFRALSERISDSLRSSLRSRGRYPKELIG